MPVPDEYIKIRTLSGGTYAEINLVRHRQMEYWRALRVSDEIDVTQEEIEQTATYQQYLREYKIMLHLGSKCHPNIVNAYKLGTFMHLPSVSGGGSAHVYIETNYVEGDTVLQYLRDNKNYISSEEIVHLALQISDALAYCHEEDKVSPIKKFKVIHNDIKLDNIMRGRDGEYVLIDFSAAHTLVDGEVFPADEIDNRSEVAKNYVAPEVLEGIRNQVGNEKKTVALNERTDIYSFGVVLSQCLTGQFPDGKQSCYQDIMEQRKVSFARNYKENNNWDYAGDYHECDYPQWLADVISKCLEKDPAKRYASGKELHEDIKAKIKDYEEQQREKSVLQQKKSRKRMIIVGFVIGIIVAALIAGGVFRYSREKFSKTSEVVAQENKALMASVDSLNIQLTLKDQKILQLKDSVKKQNAQIQDIIEIFNTR